MKQTATYGIWLFMLLALTFIATTLSWDIQPAHIIEGEVRVVDGDSLMFSETSVRLQGIDAPEIRQFCNNGKRKWKCGKAASNRLLKLIQLGDVYCNIDSEDKYGRFLAECYVRSAQGPVNINKTMVQSGWAMAYRKYSDKYVFDEMVARQIEAGFWDSDITPPWDWRKQQRRAK